VRFNERCGSVNHDRKDSRITEGRRVIGRRRMAMIDDLGGAGLSYV